ncbi:hypothetical protein WA588_002846 [Blastocystis sp. NMH]
MNGLHPQQAILALKHSQAVFFDFDGTLYTGDSVDDLAAFLGKYDAMSQITKEVMGGDISMEDALDMTAHLLEVTKEDVDRFVNTHEVKWSEGVDELIAYLKAQGKVLYVVSGSVEDICIPWCKRFGIDKNHIVCNRFLYDESGKCVGFDYSALTSHNGGKEKVIRDVCDRYGYEKRVIIGDGITDLEAKPAVDAFIGYYGNDGSFSEVV